MKCGHWLYKPSSDGNNRGALRHPLLSFFGEFTEYAMGKYQEVRVAHLWLKSTEAYGNPPKSTGSAILTWP